MILLLKNNFIQIKSSSSNTWFIDVMESKKSVGKQNQEEKVKMIQWEDFQQELARMSSLSSALSEANQKKLLLQHKLDSDLRLEAESLTQSNKLDEMREKMESRKLVMGSMSMNSKVVEEKVKKQEELLSAEIRSLLVAGTALSVASRRLQEANRSLAGERGYGNLRNLQKLLRMRQQFMVSQVALLYPVKVVIGHKNEHELESYTSNNKSGLYVRNDFSLLERADAINLIILYAKDKIYSGNSSGLKPLDAGSLTICGLYLTMLPFTNMSFFSDKKEVHRSATALGYVAHAVSLIASYLEVPLRYPVRLGGSRSYICDFASSVEQPLSDLASISLPSTNSKPVEFPLFLEGQDTTRAAYAVFLLNKDLEQLLNFIGVESLGPRHLLANLKELLNTFLSPEYIDT